MKSRDLVAVLGVAAATMAFALVLMGPARVGAVDAPEGIKPHIAQPTLEDVAHTSFSYSGNQNDYNEQGHDRLPDSAGMQFVKIDESQAGGSPPG